MTEEERLAAAMIVDRLNYLDMLVICCAGQILAAVRPMGEGKANAARVADNASEKLEEYDRKFQERADRLNELWEKRDNE